MKLSTFNQKEELDKEHEEESGGPHQNKFQFDYGSCTYRNQIKVEQVPNSTNNSRNNLQICNKTCKSKGKQLEKITIIRLNDRQIILRDQYKFTSNLQYENTAHIQRKSQLFKKSMRTFCGDLKGQKVTKNLAKNFIKAFFSYMTPLKVNLEEDIKNKVEELHEKKYNNTVIRAILKDDQLLSYFKDFVDNKAVDWIHNSKIKDKQLHLGAVKMFQNMIEKTEQQKQKIKIQESSEEFSRLFNPELAHLHYRYINDNRRLSDDDENSLLANCGDSRHDL